MSKKVAIQSLTREKLREWVLSIGEKKYHADQIFSWVYKQDTLSFDGMSNLSVKLRERLKEVAYFSELKIDGLFKSSDGTTKIRFELEDGYKIESVLIPFEDRLTLCISSQVGCAVNCAFCYTAKMGFIRNLTTDEIVNQVLYSARVETERRISNIVFMGMGEPLHNLNSVVDACDIFLSDFGLNLSKRKISVSTSGILDKLAEMKERTGVRIAFSLNGTTDEQRTKLMPINKKWGIADIIKTFKSLPLEFNEKITIEYVMMDGVNDSLEDAERLSKLLKDIPVKINLIPFNPHPGTQFLPTPEEQIDKFHTYLYKKGFDVLYRRSRGQDVGAACGQLVVPELIKQK